MDFTKTLDDNYSEGLILSEQIKSYLLETARWASFISITAFISAGLMMLFAIGAGFFFSNLTPRGGDLGGSYSTVFIFLYLFVAGITIIPFLYLYQFAINIQVAFKENDDRALEIAFKNIKSHYKFYGIAIALILGFYALLMTFGLISGLSLGF